MKKIIFMGTPEFAATILTGLIQDVDSQVIAVVTQPDRPVGRKRVLTPSPVKELALNHEIPVYQPEVMADSQAYQDLMALDADIIVTAAYGQLIPEPLLQAPKYGAVNVHASLLPKYRGGAPIHYAIWKGDQETGVSIMQMVKELDAGDVYAQISLPIGDQDDVGTLFKKLALIGRELLIDTLQRIFDGVISPQKQDPALVSYSPTIKKEEEQINWNLSAQSIDAHIRAFRPFPTTYTLLDQERVKIWQGYPLEDLPAGIEGVDSAQAGTIIAADSDHLYVQAGDQTVFAIEEYQPAGKRRMSVTEFLKGTPAQQMIGRHFD